MDLGLRGRAALVTGTSKGIGRAVAVALAREGADVAIGARGAGALAEAGDEIGAAGARQFLDRLPRPDVESIEGLSPALAIEQKSGSLSPRSTVGTATEILDYLRVLYARVGEPHCPRCDSPIRGYTAPQIVDEVLSLPKDTRLAVCAPLALPSAEGRLAARLAAAQKAGWVRAEVDGAIVDLDPDFALAPGPHRVDVFVDRLQVGAASRSRVAESVERALGLSGGACRLKLLDGKDRVRCARATCLDCGESFPELSPRTFSFNHPAGACTACGGLGTTAVPDLERIVRRERSLVEGAIVPYSIRGARRRQQLLCDAARAVGVDVLAPFASLSEAQTQQVLHGNVPGLGVLHDLVRRRRKAATRGAVERYFIRAVCPDCRGTRLSRHARAVRVAARTLPELCALTVTALRRHVETLEVPADKRPVADRVLAEVLRRLKFLEGVGLDYLSLDRGSATLSGGELQRIRLATQVGAGLSGALYVLDEPSVGLHPRDTARLLATLRSLCEHGNTVLVVEHDAATILAADHVVDMGPGAGRQGGGVVATGTPAEIAQDPASPTGRYLSGLDAVPVPASRRRPSGRAITVVGARAHNLKEITAAFPVGLFTCVTGVSGSGKSTLVVDTLYAAASRTLHRRGVEPGPHERLEGLDHVARALCVDQAPIGRTPRANPATYIGAFGPIRALFAGVPEARARGYGPARFSFNAVGGRCEACQGEGAVKVEMHFLPDLYIPCAECGGTRFDRETLEVTYRGRSIAQVLAMTVDEAADLFARIPAVARPLAALQDVGLGYVQLGQPASALSGGEAQRVKLGRELSRPRGKPTLYVLDEPTTGLHPCDVARLLEVLHRLCGEGHTVGVIEHNLDVIRAADHVIDIGPEGGERGGEIVAEGTPEALARNPRSITGRYLRDALRAPSPPRPNPLRPGGAQFDPADGRVAKV